MVMINSSRRRALYMARKIQAKLIMKLRYSDGLSGREISKTRHMSRESVSEVISIAKERNITYESIKDKTDEEVYRLIYPDRYSYKDIYGKPDYDYVHKELSKTGVTLKLLWQEYSDECNKNNEIPCGYTRFCEGYSNYTVSKSLTNRIERKPGERCEVDWSGPTMYYIDSFTGEKITVYLFVATLSYSMYTYVEPTLNMKMDTWIKCNVHMFEFFGGVTRRVICDNLKTGVVSHPKEGDIILTDNYEAFGEHYVTAIMPAGVRKPKQKAAVEGSVGDIATAIIARLRKNNFNSFDEVKLWVSMALKEFNDKPFQKREGSRSTVFNEEEKYYLRNLPDIPYEIFTISRNHVVGLNFHVQYKKNSYSVPYAYVRKHVDLKVSENTVDIYYGNERIATHKRFPDYIEYKYSTLKEHMPTEFLKNEWNDERIRSWADKIGPNTRKVIDRIFDSFQIKEQGFNPSLSVLKLSDKYSQERLENACELALDKYRVPRYHHINALLSANQDIIFTERKSRISNDRSGSQGYLRGSEYYGGKQ